MWAHSILTSQTGEDCKLCKSAEDVWEVWQEALCGIIWMIWIHCCFTSEVLLCLINTIRISSKAPAQVHFVVDGICWEVIWIFWCGSLSPTMALGDVLQTLKFPVATVAIPDLLMKVKEICFNVFRQLILMLSGQHLQPETCKLQGWCRMASKQQPWYRPQKGFLYCSGMANSMNSPPFCTKRKGLFPFLPALIHPCYSTDPQGWTEPTYNTLMLSSHLQHAFKKKKLWFLGQPSHPMRHISIHSPKPSVLTLLL